MTVNQRIVEIYKALDISPAEFSRLVNVPHSRLNNQILGKNGVGLETVQSIVKNIKNLNAIWLLTGEGEMWLSENLNIQKSDTNKLKEDGTIYKAEKKEIVHANEVMEKQIELLLIEIKRLNMKVDLLEDEFQKMKKNK